LDDVPDDYIHDPWNMPKALQKKVKVLIGADNPEADGSVSHYPAPIPCSKYTSAEAAKKIKRKVTSAVGKSSLSAFLSKTN